MARTYTAIPHEYLEEMDSLSDVEFGRLIRALLQFSASDEEPDLKGNERFYWKRVRNQEIRYRESFAEQGKAKTDRAKKAAGARWDNANACTSIPSIEKNANACTSISSNAKNAINNKETNNKQEKENPISNEIGQKKSPRFSPPTFEEVADYIRERGSKVDAKVFYDYFSAGGWIDAKGQPVRNWKQKIITWEKYETAPRAEVKRKSFAEIGAEIDAERERKRAYDGI